MKMELNILINRVLNPRKIDYKENLIVDLLPNLVYSGNNYEAYKLQIKQRHIQTMLGELNFMIRDKTNNLKFILVYCYMMEPEKIFKIEYYINDIIQFPSKEIVKIDPMMDSEMADMYVKDLVFNYISKKYEII
jgi:hypothetical protein